MIELTELTVEELRSLAAQIPKELEKRDLAERARVADELRAFITSHGFKLGDIEQLLKETKRKSPSRPPVAAKYRHPADANLTWTGRGKRPIWVQKWLDGGGSLEGIAVAPAQNS